MALETVNFISDLVITNPGATDPASQGDDHIRNIKKAIKNTFTKITSAVTVTAAEINFLSGVTSAVQTQFNSLVSQFGSLVTKTDATNARVAALEGATGSYTPMTRVITAGDGLSGGGNLTANRTLSVDASVARSATAITAGDGLSGGGTLGANRTISVDSSVLRANDTWQEKNGNMTFVGRVFSKGATGGFVLTKGDGTYKALIKSEDTDDLLRLVSYANNGSTKEATISGSTGVLSADKFSGDGSQLTNINPYNLSLVVPDTKLPTNLVRQGRQVVAGGGLTGGGDMTVDRTVALGTPSGISRSATNSVTATSHTHAFSDAAFREYATSLLRDGAVGSLTVRCRTADSSAANPLAVGTEVANVNGMAGTWRCLGGSQATVTVSGSNGSLIVELFIRMS